MTTKAILAQQVIRRLSGGDQPTDSAIDRREVIQFIVELLNKKIKENYYENYKFGEPGVEGMYIARYGNLDVQKDSTTNEYYTTLPSSYVALPKGRGLHQVSSMLNQKEPFIIRNNGNKGIYAKLPAGNLAGRIGVYPESNKIWYDSDMAKRNVTKVLVKLVIAGPDTIKENDPLPIDEAASADIVREAVMFFSQMVPQDKINNDNPNS